MTVTDADRQAAVELATIMMGNCHSFTAELKTAERHFMLTAFARHRIAALEEAATELERQDGHGEWSEAATSIRALKGPTDDPA